MENELYKKLTLAECAMLNNIIEVVDAHNLSDKEFAYCLNRLAYKMTQHSLLDKSDGES